MTYKEKQIRQYQKNLEKKKEVIMAHKPTSYQQQLI